MLIAPTNPMAGPMTGGGIAPNTLHSFNGGQQSTPITAPTSTATPASTTWPTMPSSLQPSTGTNTPNMLHGLSTAPDPRSPTGGTVSIAPNTLSPQPVGTGIDTSPQSLLPSQFTTQDLGVAPVSPMPPSTQSVVQQATADQQNPTSWNVTSDQTVQGQYAKLMSGGNLAIQDAMQQTLRNYAAAGGGNSLMAQNAATLAGSKVALTIASQDAATYAAAGQFNASAANSFKQQLNQFTDNALLSRQNFDQGVAMLGAQTNQQLDLMAANVNATAATASIQLNTALKQTQANLNATMQTMDKQFSQGVELAGVNADIASQQSWQKYGQQIRLGYLSAISQQQASLQSTIAAIQSNPNITQAQASGAVTDAINEFNTFVSQLGAYSSAMVPKTGTSTSGSGAPYTTAAYTYNYLPQGFPNQPSTGGVTSGNGFF